MTAFTPGPWVLRNLGVDDYFIVEVASKQGGYITTFMRIATPEDQANAHLISAAPDLYACVEIMAAAQEDTGAAGAFTEQVRAALTKARGEG